VASSLLNAASAPNFHILTFLAQNAVNMAKILLKEGQADVAAADASLGEDAFIAGMLQDVINSQNMQIMNMMNYLKENDTPVYDVQCASSLEINEDLAWGYAAAGLVVGAVLIGIVYFVYTRTRAHPPSISAAKNVEPELEVQKPTPSKAYGGNEMVQLAQLPAYYPPRV